MDVLTLETLRQHPELRAELVRAAHRARAEAMARFLTGLFSRRPGPAPVPFALRAR
jgi:hypothetical protein